MIKSQANIATRHDILVYFFQANVVGNVATSSPMAIRRGGIAHTPQSPLRRKLATWNLLVRGPYMKTLPVLAVKIPGMWGEDVYPLEISISRPTQIRSLTLI